VECLVVRSILSAAKVFKMEKGLFKRAAVILLQLLVSIGGLWFVFHEPHRQAQIVHALRQSQGSWLVVGFASYGAVEALAAVRWQALLRIQGITFRWLNVFALVMVGLFFNMFLPGLIGGDAIRLYFGFKLAPRRRLRVALSIVMDRLLGLFSILILAAITVALRFDWLNRSPASLHLVYIATSLLGCGFFAVILLFVSVGFGSIQKLPKQTPFRKAILEAGEALKTYGTAPAIMTGLFLITITSHLAYYLSYYGALQSLQPTTPRLTTLLNVLSIMPLVNTITSLPISIGGLGLRETLFQQFLSNLANIPSSIAAFGASLGFAIQASWGAVGAAIYLLWRKRP
jgi:uncharacterized protein (TIRG00374 family)